MAAIDYSIGFTRKEVEKIFAIHKVELEKTLASWTDSGSAVTKRRLDEIHVVIAACQDALRKFDPETYEPGRRIGQSTVDYIPR